MSPNTDIDLLGQITIDDYLPLTDLSIDRALAALPQNLRRNFGTAYQWFIANEGTVGDRMHGKRIPGVTDDFAISAQRGIHVPSGSGIALSITVKRGSIYSASDRPLIHLPNGTWLLEYAAHRNNTGGTTFAGWNNGLINCMRNGLPVGIFIEVRQGKYERHLAFVEGYHPDRDIFTLHGPVTRDNSNLFAADPLMLPSAGEKPIIEYSSASRSELEEDARKYATTRQAIRQGQSQFRKDLLEAYGGRCACSGCSVSETLQAAHIIGYRGQRSNTVTNGLLLRADLHLLFDSSLISINPDSYRMIASERLSGTEYESLHDQRIRLPENAALAPNPDYLAAHYEVFQHMEHAA